MKDNLYKKLLDRASDLIWAVDMEGRFIYINDNIREWGYDKDELIGEPFLSILNTKHISKRQSEPSELGTRRTFETEIIDKLGRAHNVVVSSIPLADDDGNITGVMGIIRDVTETQRLEEKLKNEERLASLGRLATGIAHEIRNPLSSIKMNLTILRQRLNPQGEDVEHFAIAKEEVEKLERTVLELLDYAKPSPLKLRRQNLDKAIDDTIAIAETACMERGVVIVRKYARNIPLVLIDKMKIQQALLNVILNAVQASGRGGEVRVETRLVRSPSRNIRITVSDDGMGITREDMKFIFDPFFTTKKSGTGMGLSITRNILNNHGGTVTVDSEYGKGARVALTFPAR